MSYEENPFQGQSFSTKPNKGLPPIIKETIHRKTIYEEVKINKPIVMPLAYCNSNNPEEINKLLNLKFNNNIDYTNYNNYTYEVSSNETGGITNNDNRFTYETTANTTDINNFNYNFDTTNIGQNTKDLVDNSNKDYYAVTKINTNNNDYDYNNLTSHQTNNKTDTNNYNYNYDNITTNNQITYTNYTTNTDNYNIDYSNYATDYYTQNKDNNIYSTPYISPVEEDYKTTNNTSSNTIDTNTLQFIEQLTKGQKNIDNNNVIYSSNDNILVQNSNLTFGKITLNASKTQENNKDNTNKIQITKITNNTESQKNNISIEPKVKKTLNKAQVRKIVDDEDETGPVDKDLKNNNNIIIKEINNAYTTNNIKKIENTNNINYTYVNNNNIKKIQKIENINNINYTIDKNNIQKIQKIENTNNINYTYDNNNIKKIQKIENTNSINYTNDNNNIQTIEQTNNINIDEGNKSPIKVIYGMKKGPLINLTENENVIQKPEEKEEKVEEVKKILIPAIIKVINNEKEETNYNELNNKEEEEKRNKILESMTNKIINAQKENDNLLSPNIISPSRESQKENNSMKATPTRGFYKVKIKKRIQTDMPEYDRQNLTYNYIPKPIEKNRKPQINVVKLTNNNKSNNSFNAGNIQYNNVIKRSSNRFKSSSGKKNQLNDNNFIDISEIRYERSGPDADEEKNKKNESNEKDIEELDKNLKINDFNMNDEEKDENDEKDDDDLEKKELTDSTYKRMKNDDGMDEFDNNFNNHDLFYNKMKRIFDD